MACGFVRQSNGNRNVDSEVGRGTTIRLYLPRHGRTGGTVGTAVPATAPKAVDDATVVVVEDSDDGCETAVMQLDALGYRVLEATSGDAAWTMLPEDGVETDLLFTDIVTPGTPDRHRLARSALRRLPGIANLLKSGFRHDKLQRDDGGRFALRRLDKPYRKNELAGAIRAALDSRRPGTAPGA